MKGIKINKKKSYFVMKKLEIGILAIAILIMAAFHIKSAIQTCERGPYWMPKGYDGPTSFETNMQRWEDEGISAYLRDVLGEDADLDKYISELEFYYGDRYPEFINGGDLTTVRNNDVYNFERTALRCMFPEGSNVMYIWDWLHKDWQAGKAE